MGFSPERIALICFVLAGAGLAIQVDIRLEADAVLRHQLIVVRRN